MSLDDDIRRTIMLSFAGVGEGTPRRLPSWVRERAQQGLGAIAFFGGNVETAHTLADLAADAHAAAPALITAADEEGGDVTRLHHRDGSPHVGAGALGRVDDLDATQRVAGAIGSELRAHGIDLTLAPVADVNTDPRNPVIGSRSFSGDPGRAARHVAAWVAGVQHSGVGACLKHFPGHGGTTVDSHLGLPRVHAAAATLRRTDLPPFCAGITAGAQAVMTSHVVVDAWDPQSPATFSAATTALLRDPAVDGGLGFDGVLISDALDMAGARWAGTEQQAAVAALAAGVDLLCLGPGKSRADVDHTEEAIRRAVLDGTLPRARVAAAAERVDAFSRYLERLRRDGGGAADEPGADEPGVDDRVAAAAITVTGVVPVLAGAVVLQLVGSGYDVVGATRWGLLPGGHVLRGRTPILVREQDALPDTPAGPVIVLVRNTVRAAWMRKRVAQLLCRPDPVVVVEFGMPDPDMPTSAAYVCTWGASRAAAAALDGVLSAGSRS